MFIIILIISAAVIGFVLGRKSKNELNYLGDGKWTCKHEKEDTLASDCPACHIAWCEERIKVLENPEALLPIESKVLREYLWLSHGHQGLYGDDGEMQCGQCPADYKRDPLDVLIKKAINAREEVNLQIAQQGIRESKKIVDASIEIWEEKDFKYKVRATHQERILLANDIVKEFITHYEVLNRTAVQR